MMGERLGKWTISREIGRGGMGRVYLAQEDVTGRHAALKILAAELAQDSGFLLRFQREIESLSKLEHPNIVQFFDAGHEGGHYYYAMEYVEGQSLEDILDAQDRLGWREVIEIGMQACPALKHVHDHGIVHRDLKPSNLLVRFDGVLKLTDFGIAKVFSANHLTQTGGVVGTAEYISPEQAQGKPATRRSDIYSLGVVFYYLLTGQLPFKGTGFLDLLHKHRYAQFEKPSRLVPDLPYEFDELLCQMLDKDPGKRPPDCMVLGKQLDSIRKKLERKDQATHMSSGETVAENRPKFDPQTAPGPALLGTLAHEELHRQHTGGLIAQFFNHPWVIVMLLLGCLGVFAYALWPPNQETLFRKGSELMAGNRLSDLEIGWREYLEPLNQRFPDHPYRQDVDRLKRKLDAARDPHSNMSEAERFFRLGEHRHGEGDAAGAAQVWQSVILAFDDVESERDWVLNARQRLAEVQSPKMQAERLQRVRPVLNQAALLRSQGKTAEAERLWSALESLYRDDPAGGAILEEIRRARNP